MKAYLFNFKCYRVSDGGEESNIIMVEGVKLLYASTEDGAEAKLHEYYDEFRVEAELATIF